MSNLDISKAKTTDYENTIDNYEISPKNTDGIGAGKETTYINPLWSTHWAYFNEHPELKSAILMKATWIVGKGYTCEDSYTEITLDHITGMGKDTFLDILFNMEVVRRVGRDAFAKIVWENPKTHDGRVLNLKVLDPSSIRQHFNEEGILDHYEQITKLGDKTEIKKIDPRDIFHLSNNRLADQIHGISDIESLDKTLLAELESFEDTKKIMHTQAKPFIIFKIKTDDETKINALVAKVESLRNKGNDLFIPDDENLLTYDVVQINPSQMILAWRQDIRSRFYRALGLPQVIFGQAQATESGGKIEYLAHEQVFEKDQKYLEKQIWNQLRLKINLISPVSLIEALQQDENKDAQNAITLQQNDVQAGSGK